MRRNDAGRLRIRLAELLGECGITVHPDNLHRSYTFGRADADLYAWDGAGTLKEHDDQLDCVFTSWDTMTDCCRYGIVVTQDDGYTIREVSAKKPAP